jgi:hypothetical protein
MQIANQKMARQKLKTRGFMRSSLDLRLLSCVRGVRASRSIRLWCLSLWSGHSELVQQLHFGALTRRGRFFLREFTRFNFRFRRPPAKVSLSAGRFRPPHSVDSAARRAWSSAFFCRSCFNRP